MEGQRLVIDGVALFDVREGTLRHDVSVVVCSGVVEWVGPRSERPHVESDRTITRQGLSLLPGLIDSHVHLSVSGDRDFSEEICGDSPPLSSLRALVNAQKHLRAGVTTVRDCGALHGTGLALARAIDEGMVVGPTVQAAGRVITITGGHGYFMGYEADGPEEVRKAARRVLKEGARFVKVMATGGILTEGVEPGQPALGQDELRVITEEAHNAGRRVAAHAIGLAGIKAALRAGVDSIEHGFFLDAEALELFIESGAYLVPTLSGVRCAMAHADSATISRSAVRKTREVEPVRRTSFAAAVGAGVKIAAGTDAGTPFNFHGHLASEIVTMVEYGMPLTAALVAATVGSATNLGLSDRLGSVEPGKQADLLLVDGDPLRDLSALDRVAYVVKEGKVVAGVAEVGGPEAWRDSTR